MMESFVENLGNGIESFYKKKRRVGMYMISVYIYPSDDSTNGNFVMNSSYGGIIFYPKQNSSSEDAEALEQDKLVKMFGVSRNLFSTITKDILKDICRNKLNLQKGEYYINRLSGMHEVAIFIKSTAVTSNAPANTEEAQRASACQNPVSEGKTDLSTVAIATHTPELSNMFDSPSIGSSTSPRQREDPLASSSTQKGSNEKRGNWFGWIF